MPRFGGARAIRHSKRPAAASLIPLFNAAAANVLAGASRARVLVIGSSHMAGSMAVKTSSPPYYLASNLKRGGVSLPGSLKGWVGTNNYPFATYNADVTVAGGYIINAGVIVPGAQCPELSSAGSFTWVIPGTTNTAEFYYVRGTSIGSFTYSVDGGSATTVSENGANGIGKVVVPLGSSGSHTVVLSWASTSAFFAGAVAYDTATKAVDVLNAGWSGGKLSDFIDNAFAWEPLSAYGSFTPNLTIIEAGVNDCFYGTATGTFQTQLQTLITTCKGFSEVVLMTSGPQNPGGTFAATTLSSQATRDGYDNIVRGLATSNGLGLIDTYSLWPSWAAMNAAGQAKDDLHPNAAGNLAWAQFIGTRLDAL